MNQQQRYYQAFLQRDADYLGLVVIGVRTTGIACLPTCPAKKASFHNCEFFTDLDEALKHRYRPCQRCYPDTYGKSVAFQKLKAAIDRTPNRRWRETDVSAFGMNPSTARRQFKSHLGVSFIEYARQKRLVSAAINFETQGDLMESQLQAHYESASGFRNACKKVFSLAPSKLAGSSHLYMDWFDTPLGPMVAIADDKALLLLEFSGRKLQQKSIAQLIERERLPVVANTNDVLHQIQQELALYFGGQLQVFTTPIRFIGTEFQQSVWRTLCQIPFGETRSYLWQAQQLQNPKAVRAVARANASNRLGIIVPCHRVIGSNGQLTGYAAGIDRKAALLKLESRFAQ